MAKVEEEREKVEEEEIKDAILKKALGYEIDEIVEEYSTDENGNAVLTKRKITKKHNPPDINALKFLLEQEDFDDDISKMTDSQLEAEKIRLLKLLDDKEKKKNEDGNV
ncbi:MAG: hypothetical protein J6K39_02360 [Clostridia bacterium]|nr:hypothetical protein [Clostridia bacterium]